MGDDKYLIIYKDDRGNERQPQFIDWDACAFFAHLLVERQLTYILYEKQPSTRDAEGQWVEILAEEGVQ